MGPIKYIPAAGCGRLQTGQDRQVLLLHSTAHGDAGADEFRSRGVERLQELLRQTATSKVDEKEET